MVQAGPVQAQTARSVSEGALGGHPRSDLAEIRPATPALGALAAGRDESEDHVVPRPEPLDVRPCLDDHACRLVPEHERHGLRELAVHDMEIARAHAAGGDLHEHLPLPRRREIDLEDLDGPPWLPQHGGLCLHGASVPSAPAQPSHRIALCAPPSSES
jgi:hypothetical protein